MVWSPSATSSATRRSVGVSAPEDGGRPPTRASSARARARPHPRADRLEAAAAASSALRAAAFCRDAAQRGPVGELRAGQLERDRDAVVQLDRLAQLRDRAVDVPAGAGEQPAAARGGGQRGPAGPAGGRSLEPAEQLLGAASSPSAISASTWSGTTRAVPGSVICSARRKATSGPSARTTASGRPTDCSSRPSAARAKCSAGGRSCAPAIASARPARSRPCVHVAGDRVGERPQREQVGADRRLTRLLGQRMALVRRDGSRSARHR